MADQGIKKVIFTADQLNALSAYSTVTFRYRIISEDKSSTTIWSPIYTIPHKVLEVPSEEHNSLSISRTNNVVTATWKVNESLAMAYDVYAYYGSPPYEYVYLGTVPSKAPQTVNKTTGAITIENDYSFKYPDPNNSMVGIRIQAFTTAKKFYSDLEIAQTAF